jgi:hypothetical protein
MRLKLRSDSFSARLTAAQREELFAILNDGLSLRAASLKVYAWYQENAAAGHHGFRAGRRIKAPSISCISLWYRTALVRQRHAEARAVATVAQASCPVDYDEQASRSLAQARYLATLEGLSVSGLATLERNELTRKKLALEEERLALHSYHQRCAAMLDRAEELLKNAPTREASERKAAAFQNTIDLALEEIEHMKYGDDYKVLSPKYFIGPRAPVLFMQEFNRS